MNAEFEKPYILLYDKEVSTMKELLPLLEPVVLPDVPLVIIMKTLKA